MAGIITPSSRPVRKRTSCDQCYKKKTKCDKTKPHCVNCQKRGLMCSGSTDWTQLQVHDMTDSIINRCQKTKPKRKSDKEVTKALSHCNRLSEEEGEAFKRELAGIKLQYRETTQVTGQSDKTPDKPNVIGAQQSEPKNALTKFPGALSAQRSQDPPSILLREVDECLRAFGRKKHEYLLMPCIVDAVLQDLPQRLLDDHLKPSPSPLKTDMSFKILALGAQLGSNRELSGRCLQHRSRIMQRLELSQNIPDNMSSTYGISLCVLNARFDLERGHPEGIMSLKEAHSIVDLFSATNIEVHQELWHRISGLPDPQDLQTEVAQELRNAKTTFNRLSSMYQTMEGSMM
ncbi:hypothetical protein BKA67DRAFT_650059 [Truncatella angustata]|uniref:Zn(2)-C6 fungal-type domain-containing protein n=1 Tax=Truncatella angustata TaxID=152316 RepID=A0A9P8RPC1_9PEZI|nr:uncharacterized protein BKA67DRAFT_650059 [Truncatella angustata]KAH6646841.1 hypothetical protein BKA67DRAFT_650059 [Truncatella angustata]